MKTRIVIGAAVVGTLLVAVVGFAVASRSAVPVTGSPSPTESDRACTPGEQRTWTLDFDTRMTSPGDRPIRVNLRGRWSATVSAAHPNACDVRYELADARAEGEGVAVASAQDVRALERRLSRPFWVTFRDDGAALRIHFPKDVDPSDRNLLQMIAMELQLVGARGTSDHWTALERDAAGVFVADYVRTGPRQIVKRKIAYSDVDATSGTTAPNGVAVEIVESERRFTLDEHRRVVALVASERLRIGVPLGPDTWLEVRTTARLDSLRLATVPSLVGSLERARATIDSSPIRTQNPDPARARAQRDARLLDGHTRDELLASARAGSTERLLPDRLAALFRWRPSEIDVALERTRDGAGSRLVAEGLALAGTTSALAALEALSQDADAPVAVRVDALNALVLMQEPSIEAMRMPRELLDADEAHVRRAARFCSGSLAHAGRQAHPEESTAIDQALLARLRAATAIDQRVELLSALGNSAGPGILPSLEEALHAPSSDERAAAARALRLAEGPRVDELIGRVMRTDTDPHVRSAAIFAASFRPIEPMLASLEHVADNDSVEFVRRSAEGLLGQSRRPEAGP